MHYFLRLTIRNLKTTRLTLENHVARIELSKNRNIQNFCGKPEGNRPLGRSRRRWEDNIKTELREVGCDAGDWLDFAQDRVQ